MFVYILKVGVIQWMECICLCQIYPMNNRCHTDGHCHCHKKDRTDFMSNRFCAVLFQHS